MKRKVAAARDASIARKEERQAALREASAAAAEVARAREEESRRREVDAAEEATQNKVRFNTFMRARSGLRPRWQVRLEKREQQRLHREEAAKKEKAALDEQEALRGLSDAEALSRAMAAQPFGNRDVRVVGERARAAYAALHPESSLPASSTSPPTATAAAAAAAAAAGGAAGAEAVARVAENGNDGGTKNRKTTKQKPSKAQAEREKQREWLLEHFDVANEIITTEAERK